MVTSWKVPLAPWQELVVFDVTSLDETTPENIHRLCGVGRIGSGAGAVRGPDCDAACRFRRGRLQRILAPEQQPDLDRAHTQRDQCARQHAELEGGDTAPVVRQGAQGLAHHCNCTEADCDTASALVMLPSGRNSGELKLTLMIAYTPGELPLVQVLLDATSAGGVPSTQYVPTATVGWPDARLSPETFDTTVFTVLANVEKSLGAMARPFSIAYSAPAETAAARRLRL